MLCAELERCKQRVQTGLAVLAGFHCGVGPCFYRPHRLSVGSWKLCQPEMSVVQRSGGAGLEGLNQDGFRAHALRYDYCNGSNTEHYFLGCVPGGGNSSHSGFGQSAGIFACRVPKADVPRESHRGAWMPSR